MTKLVTDVTEFKVAGAKAYLSPVMDLFNNEIVAFSISRHANMGQVNEMMAQLEALELGPNPLMHSDSKNVHSRFAAACWRPYPASRDRIAAS